MPKRTFYLLVTCTLEESRAEILRKVVKNLVDQNWEAAFFDDFMVFDNASSHPGALECLRPLPRVFQADKNVGYWSAIHWALKHYREIFKRDYDYIYIIESDLLHFRMERLNDAELFLDAHPEVGSVRTQKFSARFPKLYQKGSRWSFFNRSDAVTLKNVLADMPLRLELADARSRIYTSNFTTKLPALNRISALRKAFDQLAAMPEFAEWDLFSEYEKFYKVTGVLDGGIFTGALGAQASKALTGSWGKQEELVATGYQATRTSRITQEGFTVKPISLSIPGEAKI